MGVPPCLCAGGLFHMGIRVISVNPIPLPILKLIHSHISQQPIKESTSFIALKIAMSFLDKSSTNV